MTYLYRETQQDRLLSLINRGVPTQVILTKKFVIEPNFDFVLNGQKGVLDEARGIL